MLNLYKYSMLGEKVLNGKENYDCSTNSSTFHFAYKSSVEPSTG